MECAHRAGDLPAPGEIDTVAGAGEPFLPGDEAAEAGPTVPKADDMPRIIAALRDGDGVLAIGEERFTAGPGLLRAIRATAKPRRKKAKRTAKVKL